MEYNFYLIIYNEFKRNVGTYSIHGAFGVFIIYICIYIQTVLFIFLVVMIFLGIPSFVIFDVTVTIDFQWRLVSFREGITWMSFCFWFLWWSNKLGLDYPVYSWGFMKNWPLSKKITCHTPSPRTPNRQSPGRQLWFRNPGWKSLLVKVAKGVCSSSVCWWPTLNTWHGGNSTEFRVKWHGAVGILADFGLAIPIPLTWESEKGDLGTVRAY